MKPVKLFLSAFLLCMLFYTICFANTYEITSQAKEKTGKVELTQVEEEFIKEHPGIRLGVDPNFAPYGFIDTDGVYKGIAADYIKLICEKTGLEMSVAEDLTWSEAYENGVKKELDVLPCLSKTLAREQYYLFSDAYYTFQSAIFINDNSKTIQSFEDLKGRKVAVQTNSSFHEYLSDYSSIELSLYTTVEQAIQAVSDGKESAFVGNLATTSYYIKSEGIANLNYISIDTQEDQSLYFAVRDDWPELASIINKALDSIGEEDIIDINNRWITIELKSDYSGLIRIAEIVGAVILIILIVSFFWILKLKQEIVTKMEIQKELKISKEEAEKSNQIKSLFLARMSHEIRTPLNAIMGMAYLVKKTGVTTTQGIYLDKQTQAALDMLSIINDILDFSKIESGKIEIEKISFELDKVLLQLINIISVKVEEQTIDFVLDKDPNIPNFYIGDPARIQQILLNIVNNAVKFTSKGSVSLTIRALSQKDNQYNLEFCVTDTGIGMTREQADRLFVPFDQGDSSINRRFGGTGLGLSIVKNLTDLMNGEIEVRSVMNEGSTFCIRLPLEIDEEMEKKGAEKMSNNCFANIHALVVEESKNIRKVLSDCFKSFGIIAEYASSEDEAIGLMYKAAEEDKSPYNLFVVDSITPTSGGIAFFNKIKTLSFYNETCKYILMVPMAREDLFEQVKAAGIDFSITKPIIPSTLYNGITEMFHIQQPKILQDVKEKDTLIAPYPYHLLLVEDNSTNQLIAKSILEQAGFRVSIANNGEEGYRFFTENRKDLELILMDIHMPVMDGYEATDLIRRIDKDIPIVAMTADAITGIIETCKSHGMNHYVSKPFEPDQLIATILGLMKQEGRNRMQERPNKPVLDSADGIKRIGGNTKVYHLILQEYAKENNSVVEELKVKVNAKDYPEAEQIVHKIKSSSGNIGAKRLYEVASELQKALHEKDETEILKKQERFQILLEKLLGEIDDIMKRN